MRTLIEQINRFRDYAIQHADSGVEGRTVDDLYEDWRLLYPPTESLHIDVRAVRASLRDMAVGETGRPFADFDRDFRQSHSRADAPDSNSLK